jgi:hypothetical protein
VRVVPLSETLLRDSEEDVAQSFDCARVCLQDPEVSIFISDALLVEGDGSAFSCLDKGQMGLGLADQYTNVLIPPDCGASLFRDKAGELGSHTHCCAVSMVVLWV